VLAAVTALQLPAAYGPKAGTTTRQAGSCPTGTAILYRLYWGKGGWPSHRLTTNAATFTQMLAEGWVFEGDSRTFAFACVPSSAATSTPGLRLGAAAD
jgi:hypothetical protein